MIDPFSAPPVTQAQRIIAKFGGAYKLAAALGTAPNVVYRWTYPPSRGGAGGVVPRTAMLKIIAAAQVAGVVLTAEDLDPRAR